MSTKKSRRLDEGREETSGDYSGLDEGVVNTNGEPDLMATASTPLEEDAVDIRGLPKHKNNYIRAIEY